LSVTTLSEAAAAPTEDALGDYPFGLVRFRVPCATAEVRVIVHGARRLLAPYRKYGPTTPGDPQTQTWYSFPSSPSNPGDPYAAFGVIGFPWGQAGSAILHLTDGAHDTRR
jgi:hypothetical protein